MKKTALLYLAAALLLAPCTKAQNTAPADESVKIAQQLSKKIQAAKGISTTFTFTLENINDSKTSTHRGELVFKGNRYVLNLMGMETRFDGQTKWQYIAEANEVTISMPDTDAGGEFWENPTAAFTNYSKDFKSKLRGEIKVKNRTVYDLAFFPRNLNLPYSAITLHVDKETLSPVMLKYHGKDGTNYIIGIEQFKLNHPIADDQFTFNPEQHKGIEVVDLR